MILLGNRLSNYKNTITKKNVLIIGGAGYIGSELTESLIKEKFNITIYDNFLYGSKSLDKFKQNNRININQNNFPKPNLYWIPHFLHDFQDLLQ